MTKTMTKIVALLFVLASGITIAQSPVEGQFILADQFIGKRGVPGGVERAAVIQEIRDPHPFGPGIRPGRRDT